MLTDHVIVEFDAPEGASTREIGMMAYQKFKEKIVEMIAKEAKALGVPSCKNSALPCYGLDGETYTVAGIPVLFIGDITKTWGSHPVITVSKILRRSDGDFN